MNFNPIIWNCETFIYFSVNIILILFNLFQLVVKLSLSVDSRVSVSQYIYTEVIAVYLFSVSR
ncbi:hypothetical protein DESC_720423 [Desulfosarcina cetonica]|nr:hypothetical protein DESC_720423 [Desulfosarcina cetonica]